jgi:RimJ/RimL family protein N-acetyltransferase
MATDKVSTRRLLLRPLNEADAEDLFAAVEASREILKRRLSWVDDVKSVEDEHAFISAAALGMEAGDLIVLGVFEAKSEALVGVASLDKLSSKEPTQARLAVWIRSDRSDKGLGTEVGRALVEVAFKKLNCHRLFVRMDPANRGFRRVLKKIGFKYEGCLRDDKRLNGRWVDQECWGLLKAEWKK